MLEIYNEEYKDLLSKSLPAGKKHQVGLPLPVTCPWQMSEIDWLYTTIYRYVPFKHALVSCA